MRSINVAVLCLVAVSLFAANASAGSALSLLNPGADVNVIQDLDYEALVDLDSDGMISSGDVLYGMYQGESMAYDPLSPPPTIGDDNFTGVFALTVLSSTFNATTSKWDMVFGAPTAATFAAVTGVTPTAVGGGTIGVFYSDGVKDFGGAWIDPTETQVSGLPDPSSAVGTALWEFGFTGALNVDGTVAAGTDEFWKAEATSNVIDPDLAITYAAALNLTKTYAAAMGFPLHKHQYLAVSVPFTFTGPTHLQLEGDRGDAPSGVWGISTDTDLFIKPTPEPATMALLGLGLLGIGGVVVRRRRQK